MPKNVTMNIERPESTNGNRSTAKRVLKIVFGLLVAALIACGVLIYLHISQIWSGVGSDEDEAVVLEIEDNVEGLPEVTGQQGDAVDIVKPDDNVIDIMLIGVDNRNRSKFSGLSDVMIFMRVDTDNKTIKMASFMRDTLVEIEGHDKNKLNTAYSYGKIDLMYQTYEDNFGLKPDYYMVVNFYGMEDIINALGGVDVELESSELDSLNASIREINKIEGNDASEIRKSGMQHLNGRQAVAYMRIRKPGGDAGRIARQQTVLFALFNKATTMNAGELAGLIGVLVEYVKTDIPPGTLLNLAKSLPGIGRDDLETFRYPQDYENGYYKGAGSIVQPKDFDTEYGKLIDFLTVQ